MIYHCEKGDVKPNNVLWKVLGVEMVLLGKPQRNLSVFFEHSMLRRK